MSVNIYLIINIYCNMCAKMYYQKQLHANNYMCAKNWYVGIKNTLV